MAEQSVAGGVLERDAVAGRALVGAAAGEGAAEAEAAEAERAAEAAKMPVKEREAGLGAAACSAREIRGRARAGRVASGGLTPPACAASRAPSLATPPTRALPLAALPALAGPGGASIGGAPPLPAVQAAPSAACAGASVKAEGVQAGQATQSPASPGRRSLLTYKQLAKPSPSGGCGRQLQQDPAPSHPADCLDQPQLCQHSRRTDAGLCGAAGVQDARAGAGVSGYGNGAAAADSGVSSDGVAPNTLALWLPVRVCLPVRLPKLVLGLRGLLVLVPLVLLVLLLWCCYSWYCWCCYSWYCRCWADG